HRVQSARRVESAYASPGSVASGVADSTRMNGGVPKGWAFRPTHIGSFTINPFFFFEFFGVNYRSVFWQIMIIITITRPFPLFRQFYKFMVNRVVMNVIETIGQIFFIPNGMFPKT